MSKELCTYCNKEYPIEQLEDTPFGAICKTCNEKILNKKR